MPFIQVDRNQLAATSAALTADVSGSVLIVRLVARVADMALVVARFVAMEVVEGLFSALRERPCVSMVRIVAVIDVSVEAGPSVIPMTSADEDASDEPVRTVEAIGCTVVRRVIEVSVRAYRLRTELDGYLGRRRGVGGKEKACGEAKHLHRLGDIHKSTSQR